MWLEEVLGCALTQLNLYVQSALLEFSTYICDASAFMCCIMCSRAVDGNWHLPAKSKTIPDPMNGEPFINVPDTQARPTRIRCLCPCAALGYTGTEQRVTRQPQCASGGGGALRAQVLGAKPISTLNLIQWVIASPCAQPGEVAPFVRSLQAVPKSGLHNPLKNPNRRATAPWCLST